MSEGFDFDVAVLGAGIFGCLTALELSKRGFKVTLIEKSNEIMMGASTNNQNRLHLGYHYPRDRQTAMQCQKGFADFIKRFPESILSDFDNAYFISNFDSKVDFQEYLNFCKSVELKLESVDRSKFDVSVDNVQGGILTDEVVYDSDILKEKITEDLISAEISLLVNSKVEGISVEKNGFIVEASSQSIRSKAVVNCTYANFHDFNSKLGVEEKELQFELTIVPIVTWRKGKPPIGITVMDGPFFTILPYGKKENQYLLYHVAHSVYKTYVGTSYPKQWDNLDSLLSDSIAKDIFENMVESSSHFVSDIETCEFKDYLTTIRVVLANSNDSDRRPTLINKMAIQPPFYSVFSGKIDHSVWVAKDIAARISNDIEVGDSK